MLELPESHVGEERPFVTGGERSLYELAVAGAALGLDVELRGTINYPVLRTLTEAAGATPRLGLGSRRPDANDIIVVPEAQDRDLLTTVALSDARLVMHLLAPPGLWGWSFDPSWDLADPLTVPVDSVGRPETFAAINGFGFTLWTNALGTAGAGHQAGVPVTWIGTGTPVGPPEVPEKRVDVAVVETNRWWPLTAQVLERLEGVTVERIPARPSVYSLSSDLAPARILLWPSRIEGMSRVQREARWVGTVPVALNTNPFATIDDHGDGVVLVDDLDEMARRTRELLADTDRWRWLSAQAIEGASKQADWNSFLDRVATAVEAVAESPRRVGASVMESLGEHSWKRVRAERGHRGALEGAVIELRDTVDRFARDRSETEHALKAATAHLDQVQAELSATRTQLEAATGVLEVTRNQLAAAIAAQAQSASELAAFRTRWATRVVDYSMAGRLWGALRRRGPGERPAASDLPT
jgi:hypothetical protein